MSTKRTPLSFKDGPPKKKKNKKTAIVKETPAPPTSTKSPSKKIDTRTPAQRKFEEITKERQEQELKEQAKSSHKDRVQKLNNYLSTLTEHYDIPKVGPG